MSTTGESIYSYMPIYTSIALLFGKRLTAEDMKIVLSMEDHSREGMKP